MRPKNLIAVAAVALGSLSVSGAARAANNGLAGVKSAVETSSVDTDALQVGDQTSPDIGRTADGDGDTTQSGDQSAPDGNGSGDEASGSESENAPSDGPGGHADPPGNVDNQFDGEQ